MFDNLVVYETFLIHFLCIWYNTHNIIATYAEYIHYSYTDNNNRAWVVVPFSIKDNITYN